MWTSSSAPGGDRRLSDFLDWECGHAELLFVRRPWPDFRTLHLATAIEEFRTRQRRVGRLAPATAAG